jgi:hypothetical protein
VSIVCLLWNRAPLTIEAFDCVPLYPVHLVPIALLDTHAWYKSFFNDQLVITLPAWFRFFFAIEACYELPLAIWGVYALSTKSPKAAPHMLVWALVCFGTTATCLFEFYENSLMSKSEKTVMIAMYGSYALICESLSPGDEANRVLTEHSWNDGHRYVLQNPKDACGRG